MRVARKFGCRQSVLLAVCVLLQPWLSAHAADTAERLSAARAELQRRSDADSLAAAGLLAAEGSRANALAHITEMIGVAVAKRVWPGDSREWQAADAARRTYDYRSRLFVELHARETGQSMKRYLALCGENRREQDVFRRQIIDAGLNPDPPRG
jgi:hypothetical protein